MAQMLLARQFGNVDDLRFRYADRIILCDPYVVLTGQDYKDDTGIFREYEMRTWRIDKEIIFQWMRYFNLPIPDQKDHDYHIELEEIPATTGGNNVYGTYDNITTPDKILACQSGERSLELRLIYNFGTQDEWTQEITYCGGFTVEWSV